MADFLMREGSPLTEAEWAKIDEAVVNAARHHLVGRRVLHIYGPLGPGLEVVHTDVYAPPGKGAVDPDGETEDNVVEFSERSYTPLAMVHKDFRIAWRDLEMSRQIDLPLDTAPASTAAVLAARAEDDLIFHGNKELGVSGLATVPGSCKIAISNWGTSGAPLDYLTAAVGKLSASGFTQPYAAILSSSLHTMLLRVYKDTDTLEIAHAKEIMGGGVFESPVLSDGQALVLSLGPQNFDLAVGQDLNTAYLESKNLNHYLRVLETVALRIKRPGAICVLGKSAK